MAPVRSSLVLGSVLLAGCAGEIADEELSSEVESASTGPAAKENAVVASVTDGDTVVVNLSSATGTRGVRVRLLSIDAPETQHRTREGQEPWATESKRVLEGILPIGTSVTLLTPGTDVHKRYLSRIVRHAPGDPVKGLDVNVELVRRGAAFPFPFCRPTSACSRTDLRKSDALAFSKACHAAQRSGAGVFDPKRLLSETSYELRDRGWGQHEIVWFGDVTTGLYVPYDRRAEVDVCDRVAFALTTVTGRTSEPHPPPSAKGNPETWGFKPAP